MNIRSTVAHRRRALPALLFSLALLSACVARSIAEPFATGLNQPRGLAFDDAGDLFVAEAGAPAASEPSDLPITTNQSGRVLRITAGGTRTTVVDGLPFMHYTNTSIDVGPADVAVLEGVLYVLTGEGYGQLSRALLRAPRGQPPQIIASVLSFALAGSQLAQMIGPNAVAANPYAMVAAPDNSAFYIADGASGRVLRATLDGKIGVFAELPDLPPLTGLAFGPDGRLYVTMFSALPHAPGSGALWVADRSGKLALAADRLTMPIDVGFDAAGQMYVLEFGDGRQSERPYAAGVGRLLRIAHDGSQTVVLDRLNYPTAMIFSRAGDLYIAVGGAFSAPGHGAIVKIPCRALGAQACSRQAD